MPTFRVVEESHGWVVRLGDGMSAPFRTRMMAICEAQSLCDALRRHGVGADVVVEDEPPGVDVSPLADRSNDASHRAAHT